MERTRGPLARFVRAARTDARVQEFVPGLAFLLVTAVGRTIDVEEEGAEAACALLRGEGRAGAGAGGSAGGDSGERPSGGILAAWHDQLFILSYYLAARLRWRGLRCAPLVSPSKDGELLTRFFARLGGESVRGSTSRGATGGLLAFVRAGRSGLCPMITPDGPRGPRHQAQPGAVFAAARTGLPIVPVACALRAAVRLPSWDRFQLPLPFTRARVAWGAPIHVAPDAGPAGRATAQEEVRQALDRLTQRAGRGWGGDAAAGETGDAGSPR